MRFTSETSSDGRKYRVLRVGPWCGAQPSVLHGIPCARYRAPRVSRSHLLPNHFATTTVVAVEIRSSARKHGISDDNIRHAIDNAIAAITRPDQPDFTMLIGPDTAARLLEVGVIETENQDYVIHAMTARDKYLNMIDPSGGDPQ